ncbi:hypothetical protein ElyMa_001875500 [Elysia marginata]|uniref:Uncharacterized protein n=1 Tax=Elysia marginata TaxID=1093978 RepID=A0AAV4EQ53_9GAST|nr:hypothetical protein ElyMa_001875500 [Elysia marginata]
MLLLQTTIVGYRMAKFPFMVVIAALQTVVVYGFRWMSGERRHGAIIGWRLGNEKSRVRVGPGSSNYRYKSVRTFTVKEEDCYQFNCTDGNGDYGEVLFVWDTGLGLFSLADPSVAYLRGIPRTAAISCVTYAFVIVPGDSVVRKPEGRYGETFVAPPRGLCFTRPRRTEAEKNVLFLVADRKRESPPDPKFLDMSLCLKHPQPLVNARSATCGGTATCSMPVAAFMWHNYTRSGPERSCCQGLKKIQVLGCLRNNWTFSNLHYLDYGTITYPAINGTNEFYAQIGCGDETSAFKFIKPYLPGPVHPFGNGRSGQLRHRQNVRLGVRQAHANRQIHQVDAAARVDQGRRLQRGFQSPVRARLRRVLRVVAQNHVLFFQRPCRFD